MSFSLPSEIHDAVIDQLYDEPTTLKACCLVSKSWIPRSRRHLSARVEFDNQEHPFESWMKTFPDPSNSPAHYTRRLSVSYLPEASVSLATGDDWIRAFCNVIHFHFERIPWAASVDPGLPLAPLFGFSPTLRSLRLTSTSFEVFDFVCSFPLLEDLALVDLRPEGGTLGRSAPPTSPKLTGSLDLSATGGIHSATRRLLGFQDGLRFAKITVSCIGRDFGSATDLVSRCFDTLKSLNVCCFLTGTFLSLSLSLARTLPPFVDAVTPRGDFPDLSKATKLRDLMFLGRRSNIHWIIAALQTVKSKDLQQITIRLHTATLRNSTEETDLQEWQALDRLLVQIWTSHSIRPRLMYAPNSGGRDTRDRIPSLLPELTRRELIDLVEYSPPS